MYEGNVPLSGTAVFVSHDDKSTIFTDSRITSANGKQTSCIQAGCPYWVRVLPGRNSFVVHYTSSHSMSGHDYADVTVEIPDMQPRHVYVARYRRPDDQGVRVEIQDLGENPAFGIALGLQGVNAAVYPAKF
jgi:hypothetical protein